MSIKNRRIKGIIDIYPYGTSGVAVQAQVLNTFTRKLETDLINAPGRGGGQFPLSLVGSWTGSLLVPFQINTTGQYIPTSFQDMVGNLIFEHYWNGTIQFTETIPIRITGHVITHKMGDLNRLAPPPGTSPAEDAIRGVAICQVTSMPVISGWDQNAASNGANAPGGFLAGNLPENYNGAIAITGVTTWPVSNIVSDPKGLRQEQTKQLYLFGISDTDAGELAAINQVIPLLIPGDPKLQRRLGKIERVSDLYCKMTLSFGMVDTQQELELPRQIITIDPCGNDNKETWGVVTNSNTPYNFTAVINGSVGFGGTLTAGLKERTQTLNQLDGNGSRFFQTLEAANRNTNDDRTMPGTIATIDTLVGQNTEIAAIVATDAAHNVSQIVQAQLPLWNNPTSYPGVLVTLKASKYQDNRAMVFAGYADDDKTFTPAHYHVFHSQVERVAALPNVFGDAGCTIYVNDVEFSPAYSGQPWPYTGPQRRYHLAHLGLQRTRGLVKFHRRFKCARSSISALMLPSYVNTVNNAEFGNYPQYTLAYAFCNVAYDNKRPAGELQDVAIDFFFNYDSAQHMNDVQVPIGWNNIGAFPFINQGIYYQNSFPLILSWPSTSDFSVFLSEAP